MIHDAGSWHVLRCSERTGPFRSLKRFGLVVILSFLSLACQGGGGGTTGIPPTTVAFYQIDTDAAWSPDGKSILFVKGDWPDSAWEGGIYLHDLATGRDSLISSNYLASSLTWSPDQRWIAYSWGAQIYAMKLDGDSLEQLTSNGNRNFRCRWSPCGSKIAYIQSGGVDRGLWIVDFSTKERKLVSLFGEGTPDWFSDCQRLCFSSYKFGDCGQIAIIDTSGTTDSAITKEVRLTDTPYIKGDVAVSPSGNTAVFVQRLNLWSVDTDGSNLKQLTTAGGDWPDWSPDGKWIVYTNGGDKNGHLWLMKPDGSEKHQITF